MGCFKIKLTFFCCCCLFWELCGQVTIQGTVNNPVDSIVTLSVSPTTLGGDVRNATAKLSDNNEFRFTIRSSIGIPAVISHGQCRVSIFILPEHSFSLELSVQEQEEFVFSFAGEGGDDNFFYNEYLRFVEEEAPAMDSSQLARTNAAEFRKLTDESRRLRDRFLSDYPAVNNLDIAPPLMQWLTNEVSYAHAADLLMYPSIYRYLHQGARNRTPPGNFYSFLENVKINNPDAILQRQYQQFLEAFIVYKLEKPMSWGLRTGGKQQYPFLSRFLYGLPLYYMQFLVFERSLDWIEDPNHLAEEYEAFMASKAPKALKQKLSELKANPPKLYTMKSFSEIGHPILHDVFQMYDGSRVDSSFFRGQMSVLFFQSRHPASIDFAISYLKKLSRKVGSSPKLQICLVDVNFSFREWQRVYFRNGYKHHPITHLSMNFHDDLFDPLIGRGKYPNLVFLGADGRVLQALDWKPSVNKVREIIERFSKQ